MSRDRHLTNRLRKACGKHKPMFTSIHTIHKSRIADFQNQCGTVKSWDRRALRHLRRAREDAANFGRSEKSFRRRWRRQMKQTRRAKHGF